MDKLQVGDMLRIKPSSPHALDDLRRYVPECVVDDVVVVHSIHSLGGTWVDLLFLRLGKIDTGYDRGWVMDNLEKCYGY